MVRRRQLQATLSEHTDCPEGVERISGSRVRLPVMITRLMLAPAMLRLLSQCRFESLSRVYGRARRQLAAVSGIWRKRCPLGTRRAFRDAFVTPQRAQQARRILRPDRRQLTAPRARPRSSGRDRKSVV